MVENVWLLPLKDVDGDARAIKLGEIAELEVGEEQRKFVGDPLRMMLIALEEDSRYPYAVDSNGTAVGVLTLQTGGASLAGWPDDESVLLLRGFLIDRRHQGKGLGTLAAVAAVREAAKLTAALGGQRNRRRAVGQRCQPGGTGRLPQGRFRGPRGVPWRRRRPAADHVPGVLNVVSSRQRGVN